MKVLVFNIQDIRKKIEQYGYGDNLLLRPSTFHNAFDDLIGPNTTRIKQPHASFRQIITYLMRKDTKYVRDESIAKQSVASDTLDALSVSTSSLIRETIKNAENDKEQQILEIRSCKDAACTPCT